MTEAGSTDFESEESDLLAGLGASGAASGKAAQAAIQAQANEPSAQVEAEQRAAAERALQLIAQGSQTIAQEAGTAISGSSGADSPSKATSTPVGAIAASQQVAASHQTLVSGLAAHVASVTEGQSQKAVGSIQAVSGASVRAGGPLPASTDASADSGAGNRDGSKQATDSGADGTAINGLPSAGPSRFEAATASANDKGTSSSCAGNAGTIVTNTGAASAQSTASQGATGQAALAGTSLGLTPGGNASTTSGTAAHAEPTPQAPIQTLALPQTLPSSLNDVVKASELYQHVGGAEMRISMQTDTLGTIDLRATLHQSGLTATIGVQRGDVQAMLSNDLPSLQHALSDKSFRVDQISVMNNSVGGRLDLGGQRQPQAQSQGQPRAAAADYAGHSQAIERLSPSAVDTWTDAAPPGRLSVRV
ncbi:MAG TPA: flagellar hook-length control protein FliK [Candidatus Aquilonibacter sp.]|nr:flagellar hook-length control protein FliK [Candidatus Aquilonibacter sp.]